MGTFPVMRSRRFRRDCRIFLAAIGLGLTAASPPQVCGQLVADGETNILDGVVTNITGNLTVGTNGSFTLLMLTNGATLANSSNAVIGANATALTNRVILSGTGTVWNCAGSLTVGDRGDYNELHIRDGAVVTNKYGYLGSNSLSGNNKVVVSGLGSVWTNKGYVHIGESSPFNSLFITNGGAVMAGLVVGGYPSGSSNVVKVTGTNSVLAGGFRTGGRFSRFEVIDGGTATGGASIDGNNTVCMVSGSGSCLKGFLNIQEGSTNQLMVSNGGSVVTSSSVLINYHGNDNSVIVTGRGSLWTNDSSVTINGPNSQVVVSNEGRIISESVYFGDKVTITGTNSYWTNSLDINGHYLTVLDGGRMINNEGRVASAIVAGPGSLWTNRSDFWVLSQSELVVSNRGTVANINGYLGRFNYRPADASNNTVTVTDGGSWMNWGDLYVGYDGPGNQLFVNNGGTVTVPWGNLYVGYSSSSTNNGVILSGGTVVVTNIWSSYGDIYVQRGTLTLNSGLLTTRYLHVETGPEGKVVFNGGTIRTDYTLMQYLNIPVFTVGNGSSPAVYEMARSNGFHYFVSGLVISSNATLKGSSFIGNDFTNMSGGTISLGATIGKISTSGNVMLKSGSITIMKLNAALATNDNISSQGLPRSITYGGMLQLTNLTGTLINGSTFKLFTSTNYYGAFSSLSPASPGPGLKWNTNRLNVDGVLRVVSITNPPPLIGSVVIENGNLLINAAGGVPYDPVYLLTATNVALPLSNWESWKTNTFNSVGNASFTNAFTSTEPARYFRLQTE